MKRPSAIVGVGPESPIVVNEVGARQSHIPYRCDLLPANAVLGIAAVLHAGAIKYGDANWRGITVRSHINHALTHLFAHLAGDTSDGHLAHATCRLLFAMELEPQTPEAKA